MGVSTAAVATSRDITACTRAIQSKVQQYCRCALEHMTDLQKDTLFRWSVHMELT